MRTRTTHTNKLKAQWGFECLERRQPLDAGAIGALVEHHVGPAPQSSFVANAETLCDNGDQVLTDGRITLSDSCTITGSLTIHGGGQLVTDFTLNSDAVLRIEGDVNVGGNGVLWVENGALEIQQDYNRHRSMLTTDDALVVLRDTQLVLNQGDGVKTMVYDSFDRSRMMVVNSQIDKTDSWLLSNHFSESELVVIDSTDLPTEIYVKEASSVSISGPTTTTGIWLDLYAGTSGTIALPRQVDESGERVPYSWQAGQNGEGLQGVQWNLEIANAAVGLGIESQHGSNIAIVGQGVPDTGELTIAYHVEEGVTELRDLGVGLQHRILGDGQLTLNNVHLGPIAWQIYAHENEMLNIHTSIVNEVGVSAGGHITVHDSILQFGSLSSLGSGAASITVNNSQVYSQAIEALRDGVIEVFDSAVYGAQVVSHTVDSVVSFQGGAFLPNSLDDCPLDLDEILDEFGVPICNPFLQPGAVVERAGEGTATCDGTVGCDWEA